MYGKASISIPASGPIGPDGMSGLSDELAMVYGTMFARTLSEEDGFVTVALECGKVLVIGHDTFRDTLTIGRLVYEHGGR